MFKKIFISDAIIAEKKSSVKTCQHTIFLIPCVHMDIENITEGVWKIQGAEDGPIISFMGGTHGNELTGIECVKRMHNQIEKNEIEIKKGTLYLILGNPRAIEKNERGSQDHQDLNRCFNVDVMNDPNPSYECLRAKELAGILSSVDFSLDIHSTNKPSDPTILGRTTEGHESIYKWLPSDYLLSDPEYILGDAPVTTDEFVDDNGGVGVAYESGQTTDISKVDVVYSALINILKDKGIIDGGGNITPPKQTLRYFELSGKILLTEDGFEFEKGRGEGSFEEFKKGDLLAHIGSEPYYAEYDGVILFPKIKAHQELGKAVVYFAVEVEQPKVV